MPTLLLYIVLQADGTGGLAITVDGCIAGRCAAFSDPDELRAGIPVSQSLAGEVVLPKKRKIYA